MNDHKLSVEKLDKKKGLFNKFIDKISGTSKEEPVETSTAADTIIGSPMKGQVVPLSAVKDEAFSSEALGKGLRSFQPKEKSMLPLMGS